MLASLQIIWNFCAVITCKIWFPATRASNDTLHHVHAPATRTSSKLVRLYNIFSSSCFFFKFKQFTWILIVFHHQVIDVHKRLQYLKDRCYLYEKKNAKFSSVIFSPWHGHLVAIITPFFPSGWNTLEGEIKYMMIHNDLFNFQGEYIWRNINIFRFLQSFLLQYLHFTYQIYMYHIFPYRGHLYFFYDTFCFICLFED